MTPQLFIFGVLGIISIALAIGYNKRLFGARGAGRFTLLEGLFYLFGCISLGLGWYFNVRYTHADHHSTYVSYTKALFSNWASDSAAQDYIMVNLVLFPMWSIVDGYRRTMRIPWIFFVMSLFTSLAFSVAFYLAFVERQVRFSARTEKGDLLGQAELAPSSTA